MVINLLGSVKDKRDENVQFKISQQSNHFAILGGAYNAQ